MNKDEREEIGEAHCRLERCEKGWNISKKKRRLPPGNKAGDEE